MHRFGRPRRAPLCSATARCRVEACALRLRCSCALRAAGRFRFRRSERAAERQGRGSKRAPDLRQSRRAAGNRCPEPSTLRNLLRAEVGPKHASWDRILEKNTLALAKKRAPCHARCEASGAPQHPHTCTICSLKGAAGAIGAADDPQARCTRASSARVKLCTCRRSRTTSQETRETSHKAVPRCYSARRRAG